MVTGFKQGGVESKKLAASFVWFPFVFLVVPV
jgi:hypothetical protein